FFHGFMLFLIIFLGYQVGKRISETGGLILAGLLAFSFSPVFYPGQTYMVPSLFMNVGVLSIILMLWDKRYKLLILPIALMILLFWYSIVPILIFVGLYFFNLRSFKHIALLIALGGLGYFLLSYQPFLDLSHFFQYAAALSDNNDPNYLFSIWDNFFMFYLPALVGVVGITYLSDHSDDSIMRILLSLLTTSFLLFIFLGTYTHLRSLFFLFLPTFMLIALGYEMLTKKSAFRPQTAKVLSVGLALYMILISYHVGSTYANQIAVIPPYISSEVDAFEWMDESHDLSESLIVSDYGTIFSSMFHVDTRNSDYFSNQDYLEENFSFIDQKRYEYFFTDRPKMYSIYKAFSEPVLTLDSIEFLTDMQDDFDAKELFIVISPRTRTNIELFDMSNQENVAELKIIDANADPTFEGEEKFRTSPYFELLYDEDEVQVYRFLISLN
ncbi:MAG: hypothetical protein Q8P72_02790, partial [Candidatus Roizmanbacteria bacterium]|nr:hypothetical protein [Candidatus Roizmanbacteria bacterium]